MLVEVILQTLSQTAWATLSVVAIFLALGVFRIYQLAMPKPIAGIPYNKASSRKLLGDVPAITDHMAKTEGGTYITYILNTMKTLDAPLIQVFIKPFGMPQVVLGDFPEAYDILIRRPEFDRAPNLGDLVKGLTPNLHIHLRTNDAWKSQRRLIQDLMTPSFLYNVAGPVLYRDMAAMIDLWREKCRVADGRPWKAAEDMNQMVLNALAAFAFGEEFEHSVPEAALSAVQDMSGEDLAQIKRKGPDDFVEFPKGDEGAVFRAIRELTEIIGKVQGNPAPALTWAIVTRIPRISRAIKVKEDCIQKELRKSVRRLEETSGEVVKSAVDQMIVRESISAEKDGRAPEFYSGVMSDEIFGFVLAGHETTSTVLCWGLKFLSDNAGAQSKLRELLERAFKGRRGTSHGPSIQEITSTSIPYLDATIEEILRCGGAIPIIDRIATEDTEVLGHFIPKGTVVTSLVTGPSMMEPSFDIKTSRRSPASQADVKEGRQRAWDPLGIEVFNPDRWIVRGKKSAEHVEFDPTAGPQLAFGLGTRGCFGKRLVYLEMKIVLTLLLWNFELLPCPPEVSTYHSKLIASNEPSHTYVRLREIPRENK
ncbi:hypothetical protein ANO14919_091420 [Xylariales sp. No.14919]|nr:hypothetical protein ANO14919_091420 [Xylariales sp. No.14919]